MSYKENVKKICSFCVSDWHFITMTTPYINQKIQNGEKVKIYTSQNHFLAAKTFLSKLTLNNEAKQKIADLNWNASKINRFTQLQEELKDINKKNITLIIEGENSYIEKLNNYIEKWAEKNKDKKITVVDCYEVMQFNQNIGEILKKHDKILNTSGEKEIEEVFEGYKSDTEGVS